MPMVIKRNQRREKFSRKKLDKSIYAAATEACIPEKKLKVLTDEISEKVAAKMKDDGEITTSMIRGTVLRSLDGTEPAVSRAWRIYDRNFKGRN